MKIDAKVEGMEQLVFFLKTFPDNVERRILRRALGKGAMVLKRYAKGAAPVSSGNLKKSIASRVGRVQAQVYVKISGGKTSGKKIRSTDAWYNHLVTRGVRRHSLSPGSSLANSKNQNRTKIHPGYAGDDYMDRALRAGKNDAVNAIAEFMTQAIHKELLK